jgi:hypothetical protein
LPGLRYRTYSTGYAGTLTSVSALSDIGYGRSAGQVPAAGVTPPPVCGRPLASGSIDAIRWCLLECFIHGTPASTAEGATIHMTAPGGARSIVGWANVLRVSKALSSPAESTVSQSCLRRYGRPWRSVWPPPTSSGYRPSPLLRLWLHQCMCVEVRVQRTAGRVAPVRDGAHAWMRCTCLARDMLVIGRIGSWPFVTTGPSSPWR